MVVNSKLFPCFTVLVLVVFLFFLLETSFAYFYVVFCYFLQLHIFALVVLRFFLFFCLTVALCYSSCVQAFVTQSEDDNELLLKEGDRLGLKITSVIIDPNQQVQMPQPGCPVGELEGLGITNYLDTVFEAPFVVKEAMKRNAYIHTVAAGSQESLRHVRELIEHPHIQAFFTPQSAYSKNRSQYGARAMSTRVDPLKPAKFFTGSMLQSGRRE